MFSTTRPTIFLIRKQVKAMAGMIPDSLLDQMAEKFRMLADPTRLAILRCLMDGERSVGQVVQESGRGQANVSKHLKMLAESGLVSRRKEGLMVYYRVADPLVEQLCELVCRNIRRDAELQIERHRAILDGLARSG